MKRIVLPTSLPSIIVEMVAAAAAGGNVETPLARYVVSIGSLPPETVASVEREVQLFGRLYPRPATRTIGELLSGVRVVTRQAELKALERNPRLALLYIFHGDGWMREAALRAWAELPASPLEFAAIVYRLNDWVGPVREAASVCARRLFPRTPTAIVATAAPHLFERMDRLMRWSTTERAVLEDTLYRPDVIETLVVSLMGRPRGRIGTVLRQLMRRSAIDEFLPQLARQAAVPVVRAIALEALALRRARWQAGHRYEWVDRRYSIRRYVPVHAERPIVHSLDVTALLAAAAGDRAVVVRRTVGRALIEMRHKAAPELRQIGKRLAVDKVASVRDIAAFYLRDLGEI
jgi:hypothetical protein